MRQPPAFWWQAEPRGKGRILSFALAPLGLLYGAIAAWRMWQPGFKAPLPVLCVGNLVVGGAGKTPLALALAKRLIAAGETPWFLSRGYGSAAEHGPPLIVDPSLHRARDVGDEALLLARVAPTLVSADRVASARLAAEHGASVLVLDDGLQNPALEKDLKLVVVDAGAGIGNGLCLPAGPLRAPLSVQLDFASALVIVGEGAPAAPLIEAARRAGKPVIAARLVVPSAMAAQLAHRRVYAFAGIGRPSKFFATLDALGAEIVGTACFPDHYAYRRADIVALQRAARERDALLVTTEKDFVKLSSSANGAAMVDPALPAPLAVSIEMTVLDPAELDALIVSTLRRARGKA
ncbi:MAG: tetraacyldisaccharide 4'-kinase [Methylovirgula sp.]